MAGTLIRPYDFILEPDTLFDPDPERLRPFRVVAPPDPLSVFSVENGALQLRPNEAARPPLADQWGSFGGLTLARGVAAWCETLFFADPERHRVLYWQPCWDRPRPVPGLGALPAISASPADPCVPPPIHSPGERELHTPAGLAISAREDLVIADPVRRRLILLALPAFVLRRIIATPAEPAWTPVDVAAGPGGALYVADANARIWRLDSQGRPDPLYSGALPDGVVPRRIAADPEGRIYVTAEGRNAVLVLDPYGALLRTAAGAPVELTSINQQPEPGAPPVRELLPPTPLLLEEGALVLAGREPIVTGLTVDAGGQLVLEGNPPRPPFVLFVPPLLTFQQQGTLIVELDSRRFGNQWHRAALDFQQVERAGVRLYSLTSEQPQANLRAADVGGGAWAASPPNAAEWLVQSQPGQYLYLGIELIGPGDRTPAIERLYVYRERHSSLALLPATFQADEASRSVLDRLLSLFDTIYAEFEVSIDEFAFLLDVDSTRPEFAASFLPWLASWFGLVLEQTWSEAQRRAFVRSIMFLYRWRGTPQGIARLVELHSGIANPRVVEHYPAWRESSPSPGQLRLREWLNQPGIEAYGQPELKLYEPQHHFTILLPGYALANPDHVAALHRLLEAYIPAHTHYTLRRLLEHGFRLPYRSGKSDAETPGVIVGVDTVLGSLPDWRVSPGVAPARHLGIGTLLPPAPQPRGVFQLGGTQLRPAPRRRSACSACPAGEER